MESNRILADEPLQPRMVAPRPILTMLPNRAADREARLRKGAASRASLYPSAKKATLVEVGVLRDDHKPMLGGIAPDPIVIGRLKTNLADVGRVRVQIDELRDETDTRMVP